jgi:4-hydroxy-L-threonine phosphate dehydrogenase PdxA
VPQTLSKPISIALDEAGEIGPEVTLKAVAAKVNEEDARYLLIGDGDLVESLNDELGLCLPLKRWAARRRRESGS